MITMRHATSPQYEMLLAGKPGEQRETDARRVARPVVTTTFVPTRSTIRALVGATNSIVIAIGSRRMPACSGE